MPTFKLTLSYDGSGFVGWQRQATGISIQGIVEAVLAELDGHEVAAASAGRTDAGVHAIAQVVSFSLDREIDGATLVRALNAHLPETIRAIEAVEVSANFHARFDARSKAYRYRIWNGAVLSPFARAYAWFLPPPLLDIEAMALAARHFEGRHDFAAFQAAGTDNHDTHRTIFLSRIRRAATEADGFAAAAAGVEGARAVSASPLLEYEIHGDGFLRHMVRTVVGTLVEVGRRRQPPEWVVDVLKSRERGRAGPTAPAHGLFLVSVDYE